MNHVDPQHRAVGEIFAEGTFSIPIYQRAYAWTDAEVQTLLRDVRDARERASGTASRDYYLGTLVVNRRAREDRDIFEVVDGQQRLTTLFILLALAKHRWAELPIRLTDSTTDGLRGRPALLFEGRAAAEEDLRIEERPVSVAEAKDAAEAFYTSASAFVMPVSTIDGHKVGEGRPGPLTLRLRALYLDIARGR